MEEECGEDSDELLVWYSVVGDDIPGVMSRSPKTKLALHQGMGRNVSGQAHPFGPPEEVVYRMNEKPVCF